MPALLRKLRTARMASSPSIACSKPRARAIWKSEKPCTLALRNKSTGIIGNSPSAIKECSSLLVSMMFINFSRNQRSILVNSCTWSTVYPARKALEMTKIRLSVGSRRALSKSAITSSLFSTKPCMPWPIMRSPFWMASSKVRPIAITSPTDFMLEPSSLSTPWNLPKSQRGILQTT